ncbi:MAG: RagB/SusD family nutrient uptake outer membrane protein [Pedobacter sp.]|nr:MAG: RagB/SusD family nutrient uptake outer membrane protein [Pedobacter sp.]
MKIIYKTIIVISIVFFSCKKEFLEEKPSSNIVMPVNLEEFESILDNTSKVNVSSALGVISADEYKFTSYETWQSSRTATVRNAYIWKTDIYEGENTDHWNMPYSSVFYANNVINGISKLEISKFEKERANFILGWAHFIRAFAFFELVKDFAPIYDERTSNTDLGIPLRLNPSIDEIKPRATLKETYTQIFSDLDEAKKYIKNDISGFRNRPSRAAIHALLARIYLYKSDYENSSKHADSSLKYYDKLIDYNTVSLTSLTPFTYNHPEQLYAKVAVNEAEYATSGANEFIEINPSLIGMYHSDDLRLKIFFVKQSDGSYDLKRGYYGGGLYPFTGLATDEVYLIKAESLAILNRRAEAIECLNKLLENRYAKGKFIPLQVPNSKEEALRLIREERQKELIWRGLRWDDIKRYNKENSNIILTRVINGVNYTLTPNENKYIFPIPDNEIILGGLIQNRR